MTAHSFGEKSLRKKKKKNKINGSTSFYSWITQFINLMRHKLWIDKGGFIAFLKEDTFRREIYIDIINMAQASLQLGTQLESMLLGLRGVTTEPHR